MAGPPSPGVSDSLGQGWGPRIGISNKSPQDTDAAGQGQYFENHCTNEVCVRELNIQRMCQACSKRVEDKYGKVRWAVCKKP